MGPGNESRIYTVARLWPHSQVYLNQTGSKASRPTIMFVLPIYPDERVTLDFGRTLQQARMAKSWTQKELATVSPVP